MYRSPFPESKCIALPQSSGFEHKVNASLAIKFQKSLKVFYTRITMTEDAFP